MVQRVGARARGVGVDRGASAQCVAESGDEVDLVAGHGDDGDVGATGGVGVVGGLAGADVGDGAADALAGRSAASEDHVVARSGLTGGECRPDVAGAEHGDRDRSRVVMVAVCLSSSEERKTCRHVSWVSLWASGIVQQCRDDRPVHAAAPGRRRPRLTAARNDRLDRIVAEWRTERPDLNVAPIGVLTRLSRVHPQDEELAALFAPRPHPRRLHGDRRAARAGDPYARRRTT